MPRKLDYIKLPIPRYYVPKQKKRGKNVKNSTKKAGKM